IRSLFLASVPMLAILGVLVGLRFLAPEMFSAMVTVPSSIRMHPERALSFGAYFLVTFPILFVAIVTLFARKKPLRGCERWIVSATAVLVPMALVTMCKSGSDYNS